MISSFIAEIPSIILYSSSAATKAPVIIQVLVSENKVHPHAIETNSNSSHLIGRYVF